MAVYAKDLDNNKELNQKLINDQLKIIDTLLLAEKKLFGV
ncbi:B125R [African swine fever virus]|nr:B125R [African swine fever virus]